MATKQSIFSGITLGKYVHGGQCLADAPDGRKLFVWGGLPGEVVTVSTISKKKSYYEAIVTDVSTASSDRIPPREPSVYLSTSPWQIVSWQAENVAKQSILEEAFAREGIVDVPFRPFSSGNLEWHYRNKMEFGFWGDETGLSLAHFVRGSHGKMKTSGSVLAKEPINQVAARLVSWLSTQDGLRASDLKTVILRCSEQGEVAAALFAKNEQLRVSTPVVEGLKGLRVYFSNPKSPASVPTKVLHTFGDITLQDRIADKDIMYDVMSFFQVNLEIFKYALNDIRTHIGRDDEVIDFYSGVGTIGLAINQAVLLVESEQTNFAYAEQNAARYGANAIFSPSEQALDQVTAGRTIIVDPPRAGLHETVTERLLTVRPKKIIYLSCNPSTQARDVSRLLGAYRIESAGGYNFFPKTPHIESLVVLECRV
jgi:23S rRNA (uracil1939-C5)-methyltransferase